jgi:hypothetical protein
MWRLTASTAESRAAPIAQIRLRRSVSPAAGLWRGARALAAAFNSTGPTGALVQTRGSSGVDRAAGAVLAACAFAQTRADREPPVSPNPGRRRRRSEARQCLCRSPRSPDSTAFPGATAATLGPEREEASRVGSSAADPDECLVARLSENSERLYESDNGVLGGPHRSAAGGRSGAPETEMAQRRIDFLSLMYKKSSDPGNSPTASRRSDRRRDPTPPRKRSSDATASDPPKEPHLPYAACLSDEPLSATPSATGRSIPIAVFLSLGFALKTVGRLLKIAREECVFD